MTELAKVDSATRAIAANLAAYKQAEAPDNATKATAEAIARGIGRLPTTAAAYARLQGTVREAQRSADFTMIFHLRKTNKILVSGFSTLGQALGDMASRLESAVEEVGNAVMDLQSTQSKLGEEISTELAQVRRSNDAHSNAIHDGLKQQGRTAERVDATRSAAEAKIIDTLDNIQRGRRPIGLQHKSGTMPNPRRG